MQCIFVGRNTIIFIEPRINILCYFSTLYAILVLWRVNKETIVFSRQEARIRRFRASRSIVVIYFYYTK